jgi:DNA-binding transcriptional ArsR family regulator
VNKPENVNHIAKALSDEFRVKIISILLEHPPLRYTDLLHKVELDTHPDSGKLAYHLNILTDSGLITKTNDTYRVTEMGCQVYASMKQTVADWDELAKKEELKTYSRWKASFLLWSDSLNNSGIAFTVIGVLIFFSNREIIYGLLSLIGITLLFISGYSKPYEGEDKKKTIRHLKNLLGNNKLMPELIITLGVNGSTYIIILGLFHLTKLFLLDTLYMVVLIGSALGVILAVWLTQRMMEVWEDLQLGRASKDYGVTLRIVATITIQSFLALSIVFLAQIFSNFQDQGSHIWLPVNLLIASYNIFKDTIPKFN